MYLIIDKVDGYIEERNGNKYCISSINGTFSGLRQFLATESPLKMMKNGFYFTLEAVFVLKIFKYKNGLIRKIRLILTLMTSQPNFNFFFFFFISYFIYSLKRKIILTNIQNKKLINNNKITNQ